MKRFKKLVVIVATLGAFNVTSTFNQNPQIAYASNLLPVVCSVTGRTAVLNAPSDMSGTIAHLNNQRILMLNSSANGFTHVTTFAGDSVTGWIRSTHICWR